MLRILIRQTIVGTILALLGLSAAAQVAVPAAEYLPVTGGSVAERSVPFLSQADYVADWGYVEHEYLISGTANLYDYVDNASQSPLVAVVEADIPYVTRMIVRRPAKRRKFNGTVYLDVVNATRGYDSLTSKSVTVNFLRDEFGQPPHIPRNASRYATLSMQHDGQIWDMFSQAAALLKADGDPDNPLAGFNVQRIIMTGYSQSAGYVKTYLNSFHRDAILTDGRNAFDGYFEGAGSFASKVPNPPDPDAEFNPVGDPRNRSLQPVPAPVMRFQTATEVTTFFNSKATRQTEDDSPWVRTYEMAGGAHVDAHLVVLEAQQNLDELGLVSPWPACTIPPSTLRVEYVMSALLSRLDDWIQKGREPPASRLLSLVANEQGSLIIETDDDGNQVGGVRTPRLNVPTGAWSGENPELWCILNGYYIPFSDAKLAALYPWHSDYVRQISKAIKKARRQGVLLKLHGREILWDARHSDIGERRSRRPDRTSLR
jgi:hypothetical protein